MKGNLGWFNKENTMVKRVWFQPVGLLFASAFVLTATDVRAQGGTPATLEKVTVSAETAKRTLVKAQISATAARQIVDACLEFARNQQGGPGTYAVYVL